MTTSISCKNYTRRGRSTPKKKTQTVEVLAEQLRRSSGRAVRAPTRRGRHPAAPTRALPLPRPHSTREAPRGTTAAPPLAHRPAEPLAPHLSRPGAGLPPSHRPGRGEGRPGRATQPLGAAAPRGEAVTRVGRGEQEGAHLRAACRLSGAGQGERHGRLRLPARAPPRPVPVPSPQGGAEWCGAERSGAAHPRTHTGANPEADARPRRVPAEEAGRGAGGGSFGAFVWGAGGRVVAAGALPRCLPPSLPRSPRRRGPCCCRPMWPGWCSVSEPGRAGRGGRGARR